MVLAMRDIRHWVVGWGGEQEGGGGEREQKNPNALCRPGRSPLFRLTRHTTTFRVLHEYGYTTDQS